MLTCVIAGTLILGAPGTKEVPKKDPTGIVGRWTSEKVVVGGQDQAVPPGSMEFDFAADGSVAVRMGTDKPQTPRYTLDPKKDPPEIDLIPADGVKRPPSPGIYKID